MVWPVLNADRRFARDNAGVTSIEYVLIASIISVSIVLGARVIGTSLNTTLTSVGSSSTR